MTEALPLTSDSSGIRAAIEALSAQLSELEQNGWNGIWARILSNFFTAASLGAFAVIVGNPPWIDWKNLPEGYREKVKNLCIDRGLFSGAGRTGGINLNICALIAHTAMVNWLSREGTLAFLMPKELASQASYEGWRRLGGDPGYGFVAFHDWSDAGHPFDPVREDFMTFVITSKHRNRRRVPTNSYHRTDNSRASSWTSLAGAMSHLELRKGVAGQLTPGRTGYTMARDSKHLAMLSLVGGECAYVGREGIEFYPQELLLWRMDGEGPTPDAVWVRNVQVAKSKYRVPSRRILVETKYLFPLVKGPQIEPFLHAYDGLIVALPYEPSDPLRPVALEKLRQSSPHLAAFYQSERETIDAQTKFSDKIRGANPGEFYGLARTGPYSFAPVHVAFRDNTRWCAAVVTSTEMPWGEAKPFVFQNHAASICERLDGSFISAREAHYLCSVLNAPIAQEFIYTSSDERSYKIRPPIFVPPFDPSDGRHIALARLSRQAHRKPAEADRLLPEIDGLYLSICRDRTTVPVATVATSR